MATYRKLVGFVRVYFAVRHCGHTRAEAWRLASSAISPWRSA
jgi:hypothetical protein